MLSTFGTDKAGTTSELRTSRSDTSFLTNMQLLNTHSHPTLPHTMTPASIPTREDTLQGSCLSPPKWRQNLGVSISLILPRMPQAPQPSSDRVS